MPNLLNIIEKQIEAKGLNPYNKILPSKLLNHLFEDEIINLETLKTIKNLKIKDNPILIYPGSGSDILYPLFFLENLMEITQVKLIFVDRYNHLGMIKTILDDIGICFEEDITLNFYWNNILVNLLFITENISMFEFPNFDIYFERKFSIIRENIPFYEESIINKLTENGFIISDFGFQSHNLKKHEVCPELSVYKEMIIGQKFN
jgi:hypothetical protein